MALLDYSDQEQGVGEALAKITEVLGRVDLPQARWEFLNAWSIQTNRVGDQLGVKALKVSGRGQQRN